MKRWTLNTLLPIAGAGPGVAGNIKKTARHNPKIIWAINEGSLTVKSCITVS